jgi:hypothetical protein
MNNRNALQKNNVIQFRKQSFRVVIEGRYFAGFRLLKAGFDYGLTSLEDEAYVFDTAQDAVTMVDLLKLSGRVEPVKS